MNVTRNSIGDSRSSVRLGVEDWKVSSAVPISSAQKLRPIVSRGACVCRFPDEGP